MTSGKTTVADYLTQTHGYVRLALADPIKAIEQDLTDGVDYYTVYQKHIGSIIAFHPMDQVMMRKIFDAMLKIPRESPKPRKRLQYLGTEGFRKQIDDGFWIKLAHATTMAHPETKWVIDDVRFLNEYEFFIRNLWTPVKLRVTPKVQHKRMVELYGDYDPIILQHASEVEIVKILDIGDYPVFDSTVPKEQMLNQIEESLEWNT